MLYEKLSPTAIVIFISLGAVLVTNYRNGILIPIQKTAFDETKHKKARV